MADVDIDSILDPLLADGNVTALAPSDGCSNDQAPVEIAIGIVLLVFQTFFSLFGITLMRLGNVRKEEVQRGLVYMADLPFWRRPRVMWWTGLSLFLGSQVLMIGALALAPLSLIAPLSCVQILINVFMAFFILKEEITKRDLYATALSGGFACGVIIFGPKNCNDVSFVSEVIANMSGGWLVFMIIALAITFASAFFYIPRFRKDWQRSKYFIIPWLHCSLATYSIIFTKGLGTQLFNLKEAMDEGGIGEPLYQLAITIICILATAPTSAYFQAAATSEFDNRWFIPVKFALTTVLQLFLGAAAFNEWAGIPAWRIAVFLGFSFCCIGCVAGVSSKNSLEEKLNAAEAERNAQKEDYKFDEEEDDAIRVTTEMEIDLSSSVTKVPTSPWFPVNFDNIVQDESTTDMGTSPKISKQNSDRASTCTTNIDIDVV